MNAMPLAGAALALDAPLALALEGIVAALDEEEAEGAASEEGLLHAAPLAPASIKRKSAPQPSRFTLTTTEL